VGGGIAGGEREGEAGDRAVQEALHSVRGVRREV
jgi:hypothetical protein